MSSPRSFFNLVPVGLVRPKILAVGGRFGTSFLKSTEFWDEEENRWEEGPELGTGRSSFGTLMIQDDFACTTNVESHPPQSGPATETAAPLMNTQPTGLKLLYFCGEIYIYSQVLNLQSSPGHVAVGGWDNIAVLTRVDIFPLPSCSVNTALCSIPQLPRPRLDHSLSLLPGGKMVVCGGRDFDYISGQFYTLDTCISWATGDSRWKDFSDMRCVVCSTKADTKFTEKRDPFTLPGRLPCRAISSCFLEEDTAP